MSPKRVRKGFLYHIVTSGEFEKKLKLLGLWTLDWNLLGLLDDPDPSGAQGLEENAKPSLDAVAVQTKLLKGCRREEITFLVLGNGIRKKIPEQRQKIPQE